MNDKKYIFHVQGMHCSACGTLIEMALREVPGVTAVSASRLKETVDVTGEFGERDEATVAAFLTTFVEKNGYRLSVEKVQPASTVSDFRFAIPAALVFIALFIALQKVGLLNLVTGDRVGPATAFIIGLIASVSSCLAVVGGLVLSASAGFAKAGGALRGAALFHIGRIGGFFLLGGVIGYLGSSFALGQKGFLILTIVVSLAMILVGVQLLDVFRGAGRFQFALPRFLSGPMLRAAGAAGSFAPLFLGVATFFLPCGFTQSMQLAALSGGSALSGALIMFFFALGTFPMLALLSFGAFRFADKPYAGVFFKASGIVVILLALFNVLNALAGAGIIRPLFNF